MSKLLTLSLLLLAQGALAEQKQLLDRLQQAYADVQYFEAEFVQEKNVKYLSKPLISEGKLKFAKGHGMIWQINKPIKVSTKINAKGIFKSNQFYQNKKVTDVQMQAVSDILTELLSSEFDRIENQFNIQEVVFVENKHDWQVTLLADSTLIKKALHSLIIEGNTGGGESTQGISTIQIIDQSGNKTVISLNTTRLESTPLSQETVDVFH